MIYYDVRTDEWVKDLDVSFLPPEFYFEIKCSNDNLFHNEFECENGVIVEFSYINNEDFKEKYEELNNAHHIIYRKSWSLPKKEFEEGLRFFGVK